MDPQVIVGLAGVLLVPAGVAGYKFVQKVNRHEEQIAFLREDIPEMKQDIKDIYHFLLGGKHEPAPR